MIKNMLQEHVETDQQKMRKEKEKKGCTEQDRVDSVVVAWAISNREP